MGTDRWCKSNKILLILLMKWKARTHDTIITRHRYFLSNSLFYTSTMETAVKETHKNCVTRDCRRLRFRVVLPRRLPAASCGAMSVKTRDVTSGEATLRRETFPHFTHALIVTLFFSSNQLSLEARSTRSFLANCRLKSEIEIICYAPRTFFYEMM